MFFIPTIIHLFLGIVAFRSKKAFQLYSFTNIKIKDDKIKQYNKETGNLMIFYSILYSLLEIPFILNENLGVIVLSLIIPFLIISMIFLYERICAKYRE